MKPNYPGYLIPANPQPEGFYCLKVFIPADDYYLYAFSGAFQFFGKWLAWERDPGNNATLAAAAWREAIQKTFDEAWLNCGEEVDDCCDEIADILTRLEELENMNITVNSGCGCGCGCQSQQTPPPPTDTDYPGDTVPPIPTPDDEPGLQWKCNMSHYCAYLWRLWGMYAAAVQVTNIIQNCENVYLNLGSIPPSYTTRLAYASTAAALMPGVGNGEVAATFDPHYEAVVCAIYSAPDARTALDNLREVSRQLFSTIGPGMDWLALLLPLADTFIPQATNDNLPPSYRTRECTMCGGSPSLPGAPVPVDDEEGKWWLVPMPTAGDWTAVPNADTASVNYSPNIWTQAPLTTASFHEIAINVDDIDQIISAMNTQYGASLPGSVVMVQGHYLEFLTNAGLSSDNFGFSNAVGGAGGFAPLSGRRCAVYNSDIMPGGGTPDVVYSNFVDGCDLQADYGNAPMDEGKASFSLNTYGSTSPASIVIRHWYIVELEL